jgi:hypothetical protein
VQIQCCYGPCGSPGRKQNCRHERLAGTVLVLCGKLLRCVDARGDPIRLSAALLDEHPWLQREVSGVVPNTFQKRCAFVVWHPLRVAGCCAICLQFRERLL